MNNSAKFATVINCIDVITKPGPVKVISEQWNAFQVHSIQQRLMISQEKHGSKNLALVAHHDCAENPVDKEKQIEQLRRSLDSIRLWGFKGTAGWDICHKHLALFSVFFLFFL